jgi:hypothetical protein
VQTFKAGVAVDIVLPLVDANGKTLYPVSATYSLYDHNGDELLADEDVTLNLDAIALTVRVVAAYNALAVTDKTGIRVVDVTVVEADGETRHIEAEYGLYAINRLTLWETSFVEYYESLRLAMDRVDLSLIMSATRSDRESALISAYTKISRMKFSIQGLSDYVYFPDMGADDIAELPIAFVNALKLAQLLEANSELGADVIEDKRRSGIMSETIGESSMMFRPRTPLVRTLHRAAAEVLAPYISYGAILGRT